MKIDGSNISWLTTTKQYSQEDAMRKPLGITRNSGQLCPQTGYWQMTGISLGTIVNIKKGTILPYYEGQPIGWQLREYDLSGNLDN